MDTKKLRQKILDLAIHGKLVPQDSNDEPASLLLERIRVEKERLVKEGKIKKSKSSKTSDTPHYENVPFEVPEGWVWTTVEDICSKIGSGSTPKGSNYAPDGILFFRSQNVYNDGVVLDDIKYISEEVHQSMVGTEVLPNDLLLNITGGSLGRCAIVPNDIDRGNVSQHVCILRPIIVYAEYLHIFILSSFFTKTMKITGSGREGLPKYNLEKMLLPLPPIEEQTRIIHELNKWIDWVRTIEESQQDLVETIRNTKNKILDLAIHGKLVPQDPTDESASELLKRINPNAQITCDNEHYQNLPYEIPKNWSWTMLGKIGKWQSGSTPSRMNKDYYNGNIPWLKTGDLNDGYITHIPEYITEKALNETSVKLNATGSVLIAMYGATIGKIGILTFPATTNQACCACEVFSGIDKEFLFLFLLSHREEFIKMGGGGAQPNISKEKIINTYIPLPPFAEQKRIVSAVRKAFVKLDTIMESL